MFDEDLSCWCGADPAEGWEYREPGWPLCAEHTESEPESDAEDGTVDVFVYGTLKQAYGNYQLVSDLCESAAGGTVEGFVLLDLGAFPGAVPGKGKTRGEVLTLTQPTEALKRLDRLEGVPRLYTRESVTVALDDGTEKTAWMYVLAKDGRRWHEGQVALDDTGAADWHPRQRWV
jgi:gamma-glutamylcyclotransferase (GGCT)/AIG2-like uncharacterized protein YtfP